MKKLYLLLLFVVLAGMGFGQILITRNCDPTTNYAADRFAEIYNAGGSAVDLSNWTLENIQNGSVAFFWTLSGTINAGETKVCARSDNTGQTITPDFTADWSGSWTGVGGDGTVLKNNGTVVDNAVQDDATATFTNKQMKRKLTVTAPTTTYDVNEWVFVTVGDAVNMKPGFHGTVWRGTATVWGTDSNWDNELPTVTSDVCIPGGLTKYPSVGNSNSTPGLCNNLTVDLGASVTINVDKALTVSGTITNNAGSTGLVVQSTSLGDGSLIYNYGFPDATVQRYFTASEWHQFSIPVNIVTAEDMYFDNSPEVWMSEYVQNPKSWSYITDINTALNRSEGYLYWIDGSTAQTINYTGEITANAPAVSLTVNTNGINSIGNPYTSALDWGDASWDKTNVNGIYVWDNDYNTSGDYRTRNQDNSSGDLFGGIIPIGQGFFIEATFAHSFTIPAAARAHDNQNYYKSSEKNDASQFVRIQLDGDGVGNTVFVGFTKDGSSSFDQREEVTKLYSSDETPQIFVVENGIELSTNANAPLTEAGKTVPLSLVQIIDGNYTLAISDLDQLPNTNIILEDLQTGATHNFIENSNYTFNASKDDAPERFLLHFMYSPDGIDEDIEQGSNISIYSYGKEVYIRSSEEAINQNGNVFVYDFLGREILQQELETGKLQKIHINADNSYLIVKVVKDGSSKTQKIYIK